VKGMVRNIAVMIAVTTTLGAMAYLASGGKHSLLAFLLAWWIMGLVGLTLGLIAGEATRPDWPD